MALKQNKFHIEATSCPIFLGLIHLENVVNSAQKTNVQNHAVFHNSN